MEKRNKHTEASDVMLLSIVTVQAWANSSAYSVSASQPLQPCLHSGRLAGPLTWRAWLSFVIFCISCLIQHQLFAFKHNLSENKKFRHHPHTMGYVCANFRISMRYRVVKKLAHFFAFCPFLGVFANFATIKNFFQKI